MGGRENRRDNSTCAWQAESPGQPASLPQFSRLWDEIPVTQVHGQVEFLGVPSLQSSDALSPNDAAFHIKLAFELRGKSESCWWKRNKPRIRFILARPGNSKQGQDTVLMMQAAQRSNPI